MQEILIKAGGFVVIIILGYLLRRVGVFRAEDFGVMSNIVMKVTLPAAIIVSFAGKEIDPSLLSLGLVALAEGIVSIGAGFLLSRGKSRQRQAFEIVNIPGYNVGNFTVPFVQSFLGSTGVVVSSLFDIGNAMIGLGSSYSVASMVKDGGSFSLKRIGKSMLRSVAFMTYITMVVLNLAHISIPSAVISCAEIIAGGNAFLAMLMIGVGFELKGDWSQIGYIIKVLGVRYTLSAVFALICYFCLPFALEVRQTLVLLVFSPVPSVAPAYTSELGGDVGLSSAINSVSILVSIVSIIGLLTIML